MKRQQLLSHPILIEHYGSDMLSYFYKLKLHYKNSTVYNYNIHKISKRINISYYLCSKFTKELIKYDLAYLHGDNLVLKSIFKISNQPLRKGYREIAVGYKSSLTDIRNQLNIITLNNQINRQKYVSNRWHDIQNMHNPKVKSSNKEIKKLQKARSNFHNYENVSENCVIGSRKLGKIWGCSSMSANILLKKYVRWGYFKTEEKIELLCAVNGGEFKPKGVKLGYIYSFKGSVYRHLGLSITRCI